MIITNKKNKKKLIRTKKRLRVTNKMSKLITTKKDLKRILTGYVTTDNYNSIPEWVEVYKNDFSGPLDIEILNSLVSYTLNIDFKNNKQMELYLTLVLGDNNITDFNETTYTSLIKIYSDIRYFDMNKIKEYLVTMMSNDIKIKRRTITPIFAVCNSVKSLDLCLSIYSISKTRTLELLDIDYMNILNTIDKTDMFNILLVMDDMTKNNYILGKECEITLDSIFPKNIPLSVNPDGIIKPIGELDIPVKKLPHFEFSKKEITLFSDKIENHVGNIHPKKKVQLLDFKKFLNKNRKLYDTVLDGANIGFFKQGANSGKVLNFEQINMFADKAISVGRKPLLILHERHIRNISKKNNLILDEIKKKVICFFSPQGNDDDMYWLYSTITNPNAQIITNDEMRNHIVNISVGDIFQEWKKYKVIKYNVVKKEVILTPPSIYMIRPLIAKNNIIIPFRDEKLISWKYYTY